MCLSIVYTKKIKNKEKVQYGYKWFDYVPKNKKNQFGFPYIGGKSVSKNKWLKSTNTTILSDDGINYESGFHIYLNEQDAIYFAQQYRHTAIVKVWYKNVVAVGKNSESDSGDTVIAKDMKISKIILIHKA